MESSNYMALNMGLNIFTNNILHDVIAIKLSLNNTFNSY